MSATPGIAVPDAQQIIAELQRKLDEARAELAARNSAYSERIAYQAAANDVLKVMAASPGDPQPVFDLIVERARDLCDGYGATVYQFDGTLIHWRAATGVSDDPSKRQALQAMYPMRPTREWPAGRAIIDRKVIHIRDLESEPGLTPAMRGLTVKSAVLVPLMRSGLPIGAIALGSRELGGFTDTQVELLQTFADQAVIAIENARLFNEVQTRTRDLTEALQQQTATADVLKVISRSAFDLQKVFDALTESACRVCGAYDAVLHLREAEFLYTRSHHGPIPIDWDKMRISRDFVTGRAVADRKSVHVHDVPSEIADYPVGSEMARRMGLRTALVVPLMREREVVGALALRRIEALPFTEKQIALAETFADQAVIAIENARLFDEVQAKTRDLEESLQQQTATADVLKIVSRSTVELKTVLDTLVETAARLCNADQALIASREGDGYRTLSQLGNSPEQAAVQRNHVYTPGRGTVIGRVLLGRGVVQIADIAADPEYTMHENVTLGGTRTVLGVPLLREGEPIGVLNVARRRVEPFTERQIELMRTFADQALIAIENARLFDELRERQAELRVTFDNMGDAVVMFDAAARLTAWNRNLQEMLELLEDFLARRPNVVEYFRYLAERGEYSADLEAQLSRTIDDLSQEMRFERTRPDGRVMEVRRNPVPGGGFVLIYADITRRKQAEEAIRAARDAAETALRNLQMAQTSLVHAQKMAALGQLTAGIAHEIKNPLNFVNNFSELSVELADELIGVLEQASLADKLRKEADELTSLLKDNLGKVVQHGKRADSIVKNMLLHSREGSGEHRPVEINAIIDESLNLAYHGARAEKQGFNITLERDFDPAVGVADIYPQEVTRVLLNLISNGFYAATKRAAATNGFEPRLKAVTRNLGDNVEIRIRDNGTGIPPDIQEKIFNPFFTTKPAGEGTGLGLSMSHDIVVKQHRGTIEVVTEPGSFTEFIITLPRIMPAQPD